MGVAGLDLNLENSGSTKLFPRKTVLLPFDCVPADQFDGDSVGLVVSYDHFGFLLAFFLA